MAQPLLGTSSGLAARPRQPRMGNNTTQLKEARVPPRGCAPSATSVVPNASVAVPRLCSSGRLRGVLFDVDGTLLNSDPLHFKVFQELFREQGFQVRSNYRAEEVDSKPLCTWQHNLPSQRAAIVCVTGTY